MGGESATPDILDRSRFNACSIKPGIHQRAKRAAWPIIIHELEVDMIYILCTAYSIP